MISLFSFFPPSQIGVAVAARDPGGSMLLHRVFAAFVSAFLLVSLPAGAQTVSSQP